MRKPTTRDQLGTGAVLAGILGAGACAAWGQNPPAAAAIPPAQEKKPFWEASAALGLTLTEGNSETLLVNGNFLMQHKDLKNEISFGLDGAYGRSQTEKVVDGYTVKETTPNVEYLHGFAQYNRLFTERFYGLIRVDGLSDGIADIDYRVTISPGVGYYVVKTDKIRLSAELGPGLITERKGGVHSTYWTLRAAEKFEWKVNDKTRVWQSVEYLPQVDDFGNYIVNAELGLETALTKKLSLRLFLQDTYNSRPAHYTILVNNQSVPATRKENDLKFVTQVAYKF